MADKQTAKQPTKSSESSAHFFRRTLATEEVGFKGSDVKFYLQAIPDIVLSHIKREVEGPDGKPDEVLLSTLMLKFSLTGVDNLKDETGQPVEFKPDTVNLMGRSFKCASDSFMECLSRAVRLQLVAVVAEISELSQDEQQKLELFRSSR
jgi:hypothetical protein